MGWMKGLAGRPITAAFKAMGYTISRTPPPATRREPPPIFDDPIEALHYHRGGRNAAFHCPLDRTRHPFGFSFSPLGWHPFVATLQELAAGLAMTYEASILKAFYDTWQPASAAETIAGFAHQAPRGFHLRPARDGYLKPWSSLSVEATRAQVASWYRKDYRQYGLEFDPDEHGDKYFGPVHDELGSTEYHRLERLYESIRENGFDRSLGDVGMSILKRGDDLCFLKTGGGTHRTAAMAALGFATVPATFRGKGSAIFDVADVDYWPNVRRGIWSRAAAIRYVDHLFDFDSISWAAERGLLLDQRHADGQQPPAAFGGRAVSAGEGPA